MVFIFDFVYIVEYVNGFSYIEPSLHPWDEAYLIMVKDHFDVCYSFRFARILLSTFASMFIREIGLKFSFFLQSLCGFGISRIGASQNELSSVPSVSIF